MIRISHLLPACVVVAALAASGCSVPLANGREQVLDLNRQFPVTVQPRMVTLRLLYNGRPELDGNATGQIARFASDYLSYGSGSLAIAAPAAYPRVADMVVAHLLENGVGRNQIMVGGADAPGPTDDIRLTFIRYVTEAPSCGDWSTDLASTAGNLPHPNFGCAQQRNLAAMVADPRDLLTPDMTVTPIQGDAQRRLTVIDRYRLGQPTPAARNANQSGFISDVGQ
jgi:pilus assembly protein CpaD